MNYNTIMSTAKSMISSASFSLKKHSPEILIVSGIVGTVTSTILACKATTKVSDIIEESKEQVETVHTVAERVNNGEAIMCSDGSMYTNNDVNKDLTIIYAQTAIKIAKLYAPSVVLGGLSLAAIVASNSILRKRNIALAAAYTTIDKSFKAYRKRVAERFGDEIEKEIRHNVKAIKVEETIVDENGKEKKVKKTIKVADPSPYSAYAKVFDEANKNWEKDPDYNHMFIKQVESYCNDLLKSRYNPITNKPGYLYLNEVYDMLGFEPTQAGQVVGWTYDPDYPIGDNYVDFGLYDIYSHPYDADRKAAFVNGYERNVILDFNVDGDIYKFSKWDLV